MKNLFFLFLSLLFAAHSLTAQNLACNAVVKVALGADGSAIINAEMLLAGGPYDYDAMTVEPTSVSSADVGVQQYTVTSPDGNLCWGAIEVFISEGGPLTCYSLVNVVLGDNDEAVLVPAQLLSVNNPVDYDNLVITPELITSANPAGVYTLSDENTGFTCWGQYMVINENPTGNTVLTCNDQLNVSVDPWQCSTSITPDMILEGGPYDYTTIELSETELSIGTYDIIVTDIVTNNSCWGIVVVEDKTPPIPVSKTNLVVTIASPSDSVTVFVQDVDNGSFDSCSDVTLSPEYYSFGCGELGFNEVVMTVTDDYGNSSLIGVDIFVEYEGSITLDCPDDIIVDCMGDVPEPIVSPLSCTDALSSELVIGDLNGDGVISDLIGPDGQVYSESQQPCGNMVFQIIWSIQNLSCAQTVYQSYEDIWDANDIVWPETEDIDCLEVEQQEPTWPSSCDFVGYSVNSDTLLFEQGSCAKFINEWTVINWCQYDPNDPNLPGAYTNTSVLNYINTIAPVLLAPSDLTINGYPEELTLSASIVSDCVSDIYSWEVEIDLDNDFIADMEWSSFVPEDLGTAQSPLWDDDDGNGVPDVRVGNAGSVDNQSNTFTGALDSYDINIPFDFIDVPGNSRHRILWKVFDVCGNVSSQTSYFTINGIDTNTNPVPICIKIITASIDGIDDVEVLAKDFDGGSYDDTTAPEDLRFTFSDVAPELDPSFDVQQKSSSKIYNGVTSQSIFNETIYVWDEDGNSDFCVAQVFVPGTPFTGVEFSIPDVSAEQGERVCVPLYANNFECINSVGGSLSWDNSVLQYSNVEDVAFPGAGSSTFNTLETDNGIFSFSWFDFTASQPISLTATDPLFELCFDVIGTSGTSSNVSLVNFPTEINVSAIGDKNDPTVPSKILEYTTSAGTVNVGAQDCSGLSIMWPLQLIEITSSAVTQASVSELVHPDNLVSMLGFEEAEVIPTFSSNCNFFSNYSDDVFDLLNGYLVNRTWLVLNWNTAEVFTFIQSIQITADDTLICDFLPNDAPIGDCASGHTDTDDVEWPSDINVGDHRIKPEELIAFSGIQEKNAHPIFFNNPDVYTATYEDFLDSLSQDLLVVGRLWTVTHDGTPSAIWNYRQQLSIDLDMLVGLVSTNTINNRALPDVNVNNMILTDENGLASTDLSSVSLEFNDDLQNGLTVRDMAMLQRHILSLELLDPIQLLAADYFQDDILDGVDIVEISKVIKGSYGNDPVGWQFYNTNDLPLDDGNSTVVIGNTQRHIGIKLGDIDDDAIINNIEPVFEQATYRFEDQLLNLGQDYDVPIFIDQTASLYGLEMRFAFDQNKYELINITSEHFPIGESSYYLEDGLLTVVLLDATGSNEIDAGAQILNLNIRAIDNSVLSSGFSLYGLKPSLMLTDEMELKEMVSEIDGMISTDIDEQIEHSLSIYPNPASEIVYINTDDMELESDYKLTLFTIDGQEVYRGQGVNQVDVSEFETGVYMVVIESEQGRYLNKLKVLRP